MKNRTAVYQPSLNFRYLLLALLMLCSSLAQAQLGGADGNNSFGAANNPQFLPVEEAYQLEVELIDQQHLRLYWQLADTYYLYQHAFSFALEDDLGAIEASAELPAGIARSDEFFGDVHVYYNSVDLILTAQRPLGPNSIITVKSQGCADAGLCYPPRTQSFTLDYDTGSATAIAPVTAAKTTPPITDNDLGSLPYMLALAFIGGAILNLMPCVFPILSLKVLSFSRGSDHDHNLQSWVYTAGVVVSFVAIAAILIALQQAGQAVGWGFQLQSPGFVIALAYLFLVMGLALSGMFELGSNLMNTGSGLANRNGLSGSFFTGVLAVVVASPCTAPFMGTALGFAITQSPLVGLSVFASLGLGMAAPLLLLSYSGAARKLMPAPGPWMETLKQFLAFPLYAAAIWLLWVAGRQTDVNTMAAVLVGALMLTLALWLWRFGKLWRALALGCALLAVLLSSWRPNDIASDQQAPLESGSVAWTPQKLAQLRAAGSPVFVDVTADWCITCLANERTVLHTDEIEDAFKQHGITYMVADWTNYDADIAELIRTHGRTGIPLYLMYPADPSQKAQILPQILTKSIVLEAITASSSQ